MIVWTHHYDHLVAPGFNQTQNFACKAAFTPDTCSRLQATCIRIQVDTCRRDDNFVADRLDGDNGYNELRVSGVNAA